MSLDDLQNPTRRSAIEGELLAAVHRLSGVASKDGLRAILWEPMPVSREPPSTLKEASRILDLANRGAEVPVELCIDVGHQCLDTYDKPEDLDPYHWLEHLGDRSPAIHLQQTDGKADRHWPFTREYNLKGIIKPERQLDVLEKSEAKRSLLYREVIHPPEYQEGKVLAEMRESVKYWKEYL